MCHRWRPNSMTNPCRHPSHYAKSGSQKQRPTHQCSLSFYAQISNCTFNFPLALRTTNFSYFSTQHRTPGLITSHNRSPTVQITHLTLQIMHTTPHSPKKTPNVSIPSQTRLTHLLDLSAAMLTVFLYGGRRFEGNRAIEELATEFDTHAASFGGIYSEADSCECRIARDQMRHMTRK
uniref:Uncharacterized protein n=1 Tax=Physcomitrium patens TaxID=3218 RepID=A0A2K1IH83_PHYPA|nr:hypothetical protein PHYPA_029227 [Physcomitrium patens]